MKIIKKRTKKLLHTKKEKQVFRIVLILFLVVAPSFLIGKYYNNSSSIFQNELQGSNNIEKAWNFYKNEGFSDEAVAGILGNYMQESRMEPNLEEHRNKVGYGLAQWSYNRRSNLEKWTTENNFATSSLEGQLNFSIFEMESMKFGKYSYEEFKNLKDIKEATEVFERNFERAGVKELEKRINFATQIYNDYKK